MNAVFLDRDGVLNEMISHENGVRAPNRLEEFQLVSGVGQCVKKLSEVGFKIIVITNQPDISRGKLSKRELQLINQRLIELLPEIDEIYVCEHQETDGCACRKPKSNLFKNAVNKYYLNAEESWNIGDRWVDISAGQNLDIKSILIDRPWSLLSTSSGSKPQKFAPDFVVDNFEEATNVILNHSKS